MRIINDCKILKRYAVITIVHLLFWGDFVKKKIIVSGICAVVVLVLSIGVYWCCHPTHYKFNDQFIIGNSAEKITDKYGDFSKKWVDDKTGELTRAFYMIRENTPELIMSYDNSLWYEIYFENGVAVKVNLLEGWYGG